MATSGNPQRSAIRGRVAMESAPRGKGRKKVVAKSAGQSSRYVGLAGLLFALGLGIWGYLQLPTPQDRVVRTFFTETQQGDYDQAIAVLKGGAYTALAERSQVRGIPGGPLSLGTLIANEADIQEGLRYAPRFSSQMKFELLKTQADRNRDRKTVQFRVRFEVYDSPAMPFGEAPETRFPFTLEGTAQVEKFDGEWKLGALDFMIIPDKASDILKLLTLFGGAVPMDAAPPGAPEG